MSSTAVSVERSFFRGMRRHDDLARSHERGELLAAAQLRAVVRLGHADHVGVPAVMRVRVAAARAEAVRLVAHRHPTPQAVTSAGVLAEATHAHVTGWPFGARMRRSASSRLIVTAQSLERPEQCSDDMTAHAAAHCDVEASDASRGAGGFGAGDGVQAARTRQTIAVRITAPP